MKGPKQSRKAGASGGGLLFLATVAAGYSCLILLGAGFAPAEQTSRPEEPSTFCSLEEGPPAVVDTFVSSVEGSQLRAAPASWGTTWTARSPAS